MHLVVAAGARLEQVIGVLDDEHVMRPGDELHEHLVAAQRALIGGVHHLRVFALAARDLGEDGAQQARLAGAGRPQQDQHAFRRVQVRA